MGDAAVIKKREGWIDTAKAIAIVLVILGHVGSNASRFFDFNFVYGFHLAVFFILSGYTFKTGALTRDYVNGKFRRLMVPYFITCVAVLVMDILNSIFIYGASSIYDVTFQIGKNLIRTFFASGGYSEIVHGVDTLSVIGAIWFFPALFFALLLFRVLSDKIKKNLMLGIVCVLLSLTGYITARFFWLPFSIQSGLFSLFFLWVGFSLKKYDLLSKLRWYHYVAAFLILLAGIHFGYCRLDFVYADTQDLLISPFVGLCGSLIVYLLAKLTEKSRFLCRVGQESLVILCVHLFMINTFNHVWFFEKFGIMGEAEIWIDNILQLVVAVAGAFLIIFLREKPYRALKNRAIARAERKEAGAHAEIAGGADVLARKGINALAGDADKNGTLKWKNVAVRDGVVDTARGILIIAVMISNFMIDPALRVILFSCNMVAFVFLSGYCYQRRESIRESFLHLVKTFLIPYLICFLADIICRIPEWSGTFFVDILKRYALGMSFGRALFTDIIPVGPIYFLLMLFVVRVIYMLIDKWVQSEVRKWIVIFVCVAAGIVLGHFGFWLPWSFDVALYCLIFYHLGVCFRKYGIMKWVLDNKILYFPLSVIWAYMIYKGSMELAMRNYGDDFIYGLVFFGALCGTLVICRLSVYITQSMFFTAKFLRTLGEASMIMLLVYSVLGPLVNRLLSLHFLEWRFSYMFLSIVLQLILGVVIFLIVNLIKRAGKKSRA